MADNKIAGQAFTKTLQLKNKIWQLILLAALVLAIVAAANFAVYLYLNYQERATNNELHRELGELKALTGEVVGRLRETQIQLDIEVKKNETDNTSTVADFRTNDVDTLCKRAAAFNIACE